ncbi:MAG: OsmC-related (seleno)protein [Spirochaetaceae bacterium]
MSDHINIPASAGGAAMEMDADFRDRVKRHVEASRDAGKAVHLNRVITTALHGFYGKAKARRFEFFSDEPAQGGGGDEAPRPLEYFLAGFGFCQQAQYAKYAALRDIDLTGLKIDIKGYVDQRGILGIADVAPGFRNIDYQVTIETGADLDAVRELVETVEHVCPAHATIKGGTTLNRTIVVNGTELTDAP